MWGSELGHQPTCSAPRFYHRAANLSSTTFVLNPCALPTLECSGSLLRSSLHSGSMPAAICLERANPPIMTALARNLLRASSRLDMLKEVNCLSFLQASERTIEIAPDVCCFALQPGAFSRTLTNRAKHCIIPTATLGVDGFRWAPRSSKPVTGARSGRGGFDSHPLPSPGLLC